MKRAAGAVLFVVVVIVAGLALGWVASLIVVAPAP